MRNITKITMILLIIVSGLFPVWVSLPVTGLNQSSESEITFQYSDSLVTKEFSIAKQFDNITHTKTHLNTYSNEHSYESDAYWGDDGFYYVLKKSRQYSHQFNYTYKYTKSGYFKMNLTLEMYEVSIIYNEDHKVNCYILKNGSYFLENKRDYYKYEDFVTGTTQITTTKTLKRYSDESRSTLINTTYLEPEEETFPHNSYNGGLVPSVSYINETGQFTAPLIYLVQRFTTADGERIAWGELMWDMIMYNDNNGDGYYNANTDLYDSEEYEMRMMPHMSKRNLTYYWGENDPRSIDETFPIDFELNQMDSFINYTEPTLVDDSLLWSVKYNNFPIAMEDYIFNFSDPDLTYAQCPKSTFTYDFKFSLNDFFSQIDLTTGIGRLTSPNNEAYNEAEGFELSVPRYTYLLSSMEINQQFPNIFTSSLDTVRFEAENETVCEIEMGNDKKQYTLFDYSDNNKATIYDSVGASLSQIITSSLESVIMPASGGGYKPFANLIFSLDEIVKDDPWLRTSTDISRLFTMETQNYPKWSGNELIHDPSFKAYYKTGFTPQDPNLNVAIGIPNIVGLIGALMLGITLSVILFRKKLR